MQWIKVDRFHLRARSVSFPDNGYAVVDLEFSKAIGVLESYHK